MTAPSPDDQQNENLEADILARLMVTPGIDGHAFGVGYGDALHALEDRGDIRWIERDGTGGWFLGPVLEKSAYDTH